MAGAYVGERGTRLVQLGSGATETLTLGSSCTLGNTLVLVVAARATSVVGCSVADSRGNTWTIDAGPFNVGNNFVCICSTRQDVARLVSGDTITFTWGTAPAEARMMQAEEFSGLLTSSGWADQVANNGSTVAGSSEASGTTGATVQADEVAVMAFCAALPSSTIIPFTGDAAWSSFTTSQLDGNGATVPKALFSQYKILASTGTQSGTVTTSSNMNSYQGVIVTYKAAVAQPRPYVNVTVAT